MNREALLQELNAAASPDGRVAHVGSTPFGPSLRVERFELGNGLQILICEEHSAPVVAYHTWFRVGSRHEKRGKTGLAHLFEHLMFNETENLEPGAFDRKLEEVGAETNAATWLDWTHYNAAVPRDGLGLVVELEAERMRNLVLRDPQVDSEKEVVANERRYRVDDDVEGAASEVLWKLAFEKHSYGWPTIGWMEDIEGFTTEDCVSFYETFYSPNNATVVIVGDVTELEALGLTSRAYGDMKRAAIPAEDVQPEPPQTEERRVEIEQPTPTEKLLVGYPSPALGDFDHTALSLLTEVLFGGRASRVHQKLVRQLEIATEARVFVGAFRDPGLVEIFASARGDHRAEQMLDAIETEIERVRDQIVTEVELDRVRARTELGLLGSLENIDGKASTIGFYETVLGRPNSAFERLDAMRRVTPADLRRVARRYLGKHQRSIVFVRTSAESN